MSDALTAALTELHAAGQEADLLRAALANARADVAHGMAELARVTAGRDALAAEVGTLTRDLCTVIDERDAAIRDVARLTVGVRRIHAIADSGSTWATTGRVGVRTIARQLIGHEDAPPTPHN
jgi:uncharacterized protein (DUF3084 family)